MEKNNFKFIVFVIILILVAGFFITLETHNNIKLENNNTPFFLLLSAEVDLKKLSKLNNLLPVSVSLIDKNYWQSNSIHITTRY